MVSHTFATDVESASRINPIVEDMLETHISLSLPNHAHYAAVF